MRGKESQIFSIVARGRLKRDGFGQRQRGVGGSGGGGAGGGSGGQKAAEGTVFADIRGFRICLAA